MREMAAEIPTRWFENESQVGKSVQEVQKEHEKFKRRITRALHSRKLDGHLASSKDELETKIAAELVRQRLEMQDPSSASPNEQIIQAVEKVGKSEDSYRAARLSGGRRAASQTQHFLNGFAQFAGAFSGLLETISSAAVPFGAVGYQTLSILLFVVVNKTQNDDHVTQHLLDIKKCLPRLETWKTIYPNDEMRSLVADAYLEILKFSRAAAEYYTRFWYRTYLAINPLASADFQDYAGSLHKILAEINAEAMMKLHENSRTIENTVLALEEKAKRQLADSQILLEKARRAEEERQRLLSVNSDLQNIVIRLSKEAERRDIQEDERRLAAFQRRLGVDPKLSGTDWKSVKKLLWTVFLTDHHAPFHSSHATYSQLHEVALKELNEYQRWTDHPQSALLFLSGSTAPEGRRFRNYTHSWLSPAAIHIAEGLRNQNQKVAFFSCHPEFQSNHVSGEALLSSLIIQALRWRPEVLRDKEAHFVSLYEKASDTTREQILVDVLIELLMDLRDFKSVYLVIDRMDCCETKIDHICNELTRLITKLDSPDFRVKVCIVAETSGGNGHWYCEFLPSHEYSTERLFDVRNWNQQRLAMGTSSSHLGGHISDSH